MTKQTKIVATLGPSSESPEMIGSLIDAGVNVFRFNFKHAEVAWHEEKINLVRTVAKNKHAAIAVLLDLQGPSFRIILPQDQINISVGQTFEFGSAEFGLTHPQIIPHLQDGQKLLLDDGTITFYVRHKDGKIMVESATNGVLKTRKSLNIPGADFPCEILTERDREGLKLVPKLKVEFVALSFVRSASDIESVRKDLSALGSESKIIAKIETQKALDHLDEIVTASDGIMVARGDLGVELPIEEVPYYQKIMITKCVEQGKPVITATQMLETMVKNPYPTRAEVSDVANAVYDQTDAVMLSGESAYGDYPLETVQMMAKTLAFHDARDLAVEHHDIKYVTEETGAIVCDAANCMYQNFKKQSKKLSGFLVLTHTGRAAQLLARYRPKLPIFAYTPNEEVCNRLALTYGVVPFSQDLPLAKEVTDQDIQTLVAHLKEKNLVEVGSQLIVVHGAWWFKTGGTSAVHVLEVA